MIEGDLAKFGRDGQVDWKIHSGHAEISELPTPPFPPNEASLHGKILGFKNSTSTTRLKHKSDVIAKQFLPLVQSGFHDRSCLDELTQGNPLRYSGILGSYKTFPTRAGLVPYAEKFGWMVWYHGQVMPPNSGVIVFGVMRTTTYLFPLTENLYSKAQGGIHLSKNWELHAQTTRLTPA
jgi:hypothetical protein